MLTILDVLDQTRELNVAGDVPTVPGVELPASAVA
jgi:hypothetical protein